MSDINQDISVSNLDRVPGKICWSALSMTTLYHVCLLHFNLVQPRSFLSCEYFSVAHCPRENFWINLDIDGLSHSSIQIVSQKLRRGAYGSSRCTVSGPNVAYHATFHYIYSLCEIDPSRAPVAQNSTSTDGTNRS